MPAEPPAAEHDVAEPDATPPWPAPAPRRRPSAWGYVFVGLIALGLGAVAALQVRSRLLDALPADMPWQQRDLLQVIAHHRRIYAEQDGEVRKSAVRYERALAIARVLGDRRAEGWRGRLERMRTIEGRAFVEVAIGERVVVRSVGGLVADLPFGTLIPPGTELFGRLTRLREGEAVVFSGTFLTGERDFIREGSRSEELAMTRPEFILRFDAIDEAVGKGKP